jgi:ATP-dependent Lhr-like helicase
VEVLRVIKRRVLARLRREAEPVEPVVYARFLLAWHGIPGRRRGRDGLRDAIGQLEGYPVPASVLERFVLPARVEDYAPAMLDELCATGEVAWFGAGRIRDDDGRVVLVARERLPQFIPEPAEPATSLEAEILEQLERRGAQFFTDLVAATGRPVGEVLESLWNLVWAGRVTNDTFTPVRAWLGRRSGVRAAASGRLHRLPPESAGRWSVLPAPDDRTRSIHAWSLALLERRGVVTRESANAEAFRGGFTALYPVLREMEERGRARRGYFVEGLGGAQFALPGAVDRLRAERDTGEQPTALLLAASDPAQPYGEVLPWPADDVPGGRRFPARTAGNFVILVDGQPVLGLERWGRTLLTLPAALADEAALEAAIACLVQVAPALAPRGLVVERIDGAPAPDSPLAGELLVRGFRQGYRGLVYRPNLSGVTVRA